MMLLILAVFCLAGAAFLVGEFVMLPARQRSLSVRRAATYGAMEVPSGTPQEGIRERVLGPVGAWLAKWALKVNPRSSTEAVAMRILAAGMGRKLSPTSFLAIKGLCALIGIFLGSLVGSSRGLGGLLMGAMFIGAAITFINPTYMDPLYHSHVGHMLIYSGLAMMAFGSLILKKIVSFKG